MEQLTLAIDGMSCGHCVARVTRALGALPGVSLEQVEVGSARLGYDPALVSAERLLEAIGAVGYQARVSA